VGPARCVPTALHRAFCNGLHFCRDTLTLTQASQGEPYCLLSEGLDGGGFLGAFFTAASLLTRDFSMKLNTPVPFNYHADPHQCLSCHHRVPRSREMRCHILRITFSPRALKKEGRESDERIG
jgi:hypothetical protein